MRDFLVLVRLSINKFSSLELKSFLIFLFNYYLHYLHVFNYCENHNNYNFMYSFAEESHKEETMDAISDK